MFENRRNSELLPKNENFVMADGFDDSDDDDFISQLNTQNQAIAQSQVIFIICDGPPIVGSMDLTI